MNKVWDFLKPPLAGRINKPRSSGITMLIDKGLALRETEDLVQLNSQYFDFLKLTFGTAALYPKSILLKKVAILESHGVNTYPGGTFFEIAKWQQKTSEYFGSLVELGFKWVEISDGTLEISLAERSEAINQALRAGLKVITEVGKKDPGRDPEIGVLIQTALSDLKTGAEFVIIEGRESGKGIGIFDNQGGVIINKLADLSLYLDQTKIIWETPLKDQQAQLINKFGPNVNLGNIPPGEVMALEALRMGYRSDTWRNF